MKPKNRYRITLGVIDTAVYVNRSKLTIYSFIYFYIEKLLNYTLIFEIVYVEMQWRNFKFWAPLQDFQKGPPTATNNLTDNICLNHQINY